jgi:predicted secreted hydrolase
VPTTTPVPTPVSTAVPWLKRPPAPIALPADEAPHDVLTEWWYYTGHLDGRDGARYGFEFVVFQVRIGEGGPLYLSHFAVTDIGRGRFRYDQRQASGPQPPPAGGGFALALDDWRMAGRDGRDQLAATMDGYGIDLTLTARKPPALHLGEGFISFGAAGDSYYYSRTRMAVEGTIVADGVRRPVTGEAWFDHQWGDFISVKGGGWDWYSVQLTDQSEVMIFNVRDPSGKPVILYGSLVDPAGRTTDLQAGEIGLEATGEWTSPRSGATYPSGWRLRLPAHALDLTVTPVLLDQELDTEATTGVIYWEGAVDVAGTRHGRPITGRGYVELTGYAP